VSRRKDAWRMSKSTRKCWATSFITLPISPSNMLNIP